MHDKPNMTAMVATLRYYAKSSRRLAEILGVTENQVSRWLRGKANPPESIVVIVELLEALPVKDWPERWR